MKPSFAKKYAAFGAITVWLSIVSQLYIALDTMPLPVPEILLQFFSYFTILTNIVVASCFTAIALGASTSFLTKPATLTAVTTYIIMVCAVANTLLVGLLDLEGLAYITDKFLHLVNPIVMFIFWILFVEKGALKWKQAFYWLWYPAAYIIYIIFLGSATGFYPYPFANAEKLGMQQALTNGVMITGLFGLVGLLLIAISRIGNSK